MRIFAIADTHLSFGCDKPMDVFGDLWRDHPARLARNWDEVVTDEDVVLIAGDISWARSHEQVAPDLQFLHDRPGRMKLLLKGNHDSWWSSPRRLQELLPPSLQLIHKNAIRVDRGVVVCGARGWTVPNSGQTEEVTEHDRKLYQRELQRLQLSVQAAGQLRAPEDRLIAMLHFPPLGPEQKSGEVTRVLAAAGVEIAVYGHLHGEDHAWAPQGRFDGVNLQFVAADYLSFTPQLVMKEAR